MSKRVWVLIAIVVLVLSLAALSICCIAAFVATNDPLGKTFNEATMEQEMNEAASEYKSAIEDVPRMPGSEFEIGTITVYREDETGRPVVIDANIVLIADSTAIPELFDRLDEIHFEMEILLSVAPLEDLTERENRADLIEEIKTIANNYLSGGGRVRDAYFAEFEIR